MLQYIFKEKIMTRKQELYLLHLIHFTKSQESWVIFRFYGNYLSIR
jgi:hypothetical protein